MAKLSEPCQRGDHNHCPVQQPYDHDYPDCQCECHPGILPGHLGPEMWEDKASQTKKLELE
jgi:hypothetical protein